MPPPLIAAMKPAMAASQGRALSLEGGLPPPAGSSDGAGVGVSAGVGVGVGAGVGVGVGAGVGVGVAGGGSSNS